MTISRDRFVLGFFSISLSLITACLVQRLSAPSGLQEALSRDIFLVTLHSFNISILFGWLAFGVLGGMILTVIAVVMGLWASLHSGIYAYSLVTVTFMITDLIGYIYTSAEGRLEQSYNLRNEKLDEEINISANTIKDRKASIASLEQKLRRYSMLKDVVEELSMALAPDDIFRLIIERTSDTLKKDGRTMLFLVDTEKQELILTASSSAAHVRAKKGDVFDHWVLRHRKSLMIEDIGKDFRFPTADTEEAGSSFTSLIAAPLVSEDKIVGILRADSAHEFTFTQDDLRLLDIIANVGVVAIQNSVLYARTEELAIRDGLTGLYVRRYFMERFSEEVRRAARNKSGFSLLLIDIDNFKEYNDRYGHMAGDLVLKHLSGIMRQVAREGDIAARYGGEELVILLVGMKKDEAMKVAESIKAAAEGNPLILRRQESHVTVSIGLASYPEDSTLKDELIKAADMRLYKAKAGGRNRICAA